jgi:hypothetical protein
MADKIEMCREFFEECLRDAYKWGYGDGQNNPNGYSNNKNLDECVTYLSKPTIKRDDDDEPH